MHSKAALILFAAILSCQFCGCATLLCDHNGIPATCLPPQWQAESQGYKSRVDLTFLRQNPPDTHHIGPGDILGIYIRGILGEEDDAPPVEYPLEDTNVDAPAVGHPVTVDREGEVTLPDVNDIHLGGMTLDQARRRIREAYVAKGILNPDDGRDHAITVTLIKPRTERILVVREDAAAVVPEFKREQDHTIYSKRGSASLVELPAYENDLLHALVATGGLPGLDAKDEVWILRRRSVDPGALQQLADSVGSSDDPSDIMHAHFSESEIIRIPLHVYAEDIAPFSVEDTILHTGDVVFIESREEEFFYSGGLLSGAQIPLPRDYSLDVIGAIALAGGNVAGPAGANAAATNFRSGPGNIIPPSKVIIVRSIPGDGQIKICVDLKKALDDPQERILIQPGDVVLLKYTPCELLGNVALNFVNFTYIFR